MGTLEVLHPGVLSSVQDTGRIGFKHFGVPQSGASDSVALRIGNRLIGNAESEAAIEMTMLGGEFKCLTSMLICLTGARAADAVVSNGRNQDSVLHEQPTLIPAGSTLKIGRFTCGFRGYLCRTPIHNETSGCRTAAFLAFSRGQTPHPT